MQAKAGVIDLLNNILTADLTAVNQYFLHAKMCENWGYERLYHTVRQRSIDEMRDVEALIAHILYLEGVPNMQRLGTVEECVGLARNETLQAVGAALGEFMPGDSHRSLAYQTNLERETLETGLTACKAPELVPSGGGDG